MCLHTCWSPVWVVPAELPADDVSADAPEIEQGLACWPQSEWDQLSSQNHHCEKLNQEQTLLPPHPPRLPSRHPHTLTLGQNGSAALWIRVERSQLWLPVKRLNTMSYDWFFCVNMQRDDSKLWDLHLSTRWCQQLGRSCLTYVPGMRMVIAACTALRMMLSIANIQWGLMWWFLRTLFTWECYTQADMEGHFDWVLMIL